MGWNFRVRPHIGPIHLNISKRGYRSTSITLWRFTWNFTTKRWSFDTPGPGSISGGRARRNRTRQ